MINPFVICNVAEQEVYRQYADTQTWILQCRALGATEEVAREFDRRARVYAPTTPYPNSDVIAYLRRLALEALARGEPMPTTAEEAIERDHRRYMERLAALCGR